MKRKKRQQRLSEARQKGRRIETDFAQAYLHRWRSVSQYQSIIVQNKFNVYSRRRTTGATASRTFQTERYFQCLKKMKENE